MSEDVVTVEDLTFGFRTEDGFIEILSSVSFSVARGEIFALVGESGCGKSVTCLALAKLHSEPSARYLGGRILIHGENVLAMGHAQLRRMRGKTLAYVFQEPSVCLNPVLRVGSQIAETVRLHEGRTANARSRVFELLHMVGIPEPETMARAYPNELSGGMQQRVMIAMAISCSPAVLVADEPTTALDVTVQAQVLDLLKRLRRETGMTILLVTHNLGIVADIADTVAVMYAGQIVETAPARELLSSPAHPYTQALLRAVPRPGTRGQKLGTIPGKVPSPSDYSRACRFAERCAIAQADCRTTAPTEVALSSSRTVRCRYADRYRVP